jgi:tetratricopeptide (TPR) repeat protein
MNITYQQPLSFVLLLFLFLSCNERNTKPSKELIKAINLKRGPVVSCGPADKQFGTVVFEVSGNAKLKEEFHLGIQLLHSFEYDEAEKVFAKIIDGQPEFAMAYWGVAMANFHPLWAPPSEAELKKGTQALEIAQAIPQKSKKEANYIEALSAFYTNWEKVAHRARCLEYEKAMEKMYTNYPDDKEAAIFYALSLVAAVDPSDKTYQKQKKAGSILNALYPNEPNHPGIVHYLIHAYDYPGLAALGLPAARKYASVAPSSAHALHMPSHIFTRLGLWDDCIQSNLASVISARCYAESAGIKGHWDEELHGMDYLVYAYLQKGNNDSAKKQWDYLKTIKEVSPANLKVAYAFAAVPSRYLLENHQWREAANLEVEPQGFNWKDFLWQKAIVHYTRLLGSVHINDLRAAKNELNNLHIIHDTLVMQKKAYEANLVQIQVNTAQAWVVFKEGKKNEALQLMSLAAEMEDKTEKHPVTPSAVLPARELLGYMFMQLNKYANALEAYEADLKVNPNRFNALHGAALAADKLGNVEKAKFYYRQLLATAGETNSDRPELTVAKHYLKAKIM